MENRKLMILGKLKTNLCPNKRNELLKEYNSINNKTKQHERKYTKHL